MATHVTEVLKFPSLYSDGAWYRALDQGAFESSHSLSWLADVCLFIY